MHALILGFDSFDPKLLETFSDQGDLPNLSKLAEREGYSPFKVCAPPQTEASLGSVDWAKTKAYSIGLNSLYINLKGREGQGIVPIEQVEDLATEVKD